MIKNILSALFIAIVIISALFIIFNIYAKDFIVSRMESALGLKVGLEKVSLNFPLSVEFKNLKLGQDLSAERVSVAVNPFGFIAGKVLLDEVFIINPVINLEQSAQGKLNLSKLLKENKGKPMPVFATRIIIQNGTINFTDNKVASYGFRVSMNKINADVGKVMFPVTSLKTEFNISCELDRPQGQALGNLSLNGWLDFGHKSMDATFIIRDLEATYFTPYFGDFLSHRKLESATVNLTSQLKAQDNDLVVNNDLNLSGLKYAAQQEQAPGELPEFNLAKNALDLFTDRSGNLKLNFEIKTKLDHPEVSQEQLKKTILNAAMKNLVNQNPVDLMEKVSSIIQQASKYGKQMKDIFSGKAPQQDAQPSDQKQ